MSKFKPTTYKLFCGNREWTGHLAEIPHPIERLNWQSSNSWWKDSNSLNCSVILLCMVYNYVDNCPFIIVFEYTQKIYVFESPIIFHMLVEFSPTHGTMTFNNIKAHTHSKICPTPSPPCFLTDAISNFWQGYSESSSRLPFGLDYNICIQ